MYISASPSSRPHTEQVCSSGTEAASTAAVCAAEAAAAAETAPGSEKRTAARPGVPVRERGPVVRGGIVAASWPEGGVDPKQESSAADGLATPPQLPESVIWAPRPKTRQRGGRRRPPQSLARPWRRER